MGNEKRPTAPDGADSPARTDETTGKPDETSHEGKSPVAPGQPRPRNGTAGRNLTLGRKIKKYLN